MSDLIWNTLFGSLIIFVFIFLGFAFNETLKQDAFKEKLYEQCIKDKREPYECYYYVRGRR